MKYFCLNNLAPKTNPTPQVPPVNILQSNYLITTKVDRQGLG